MTSSVNTLLLGTPDANVAPDEIDIDIASKLDISVKKEEILADEGTVATSDLIGRYDVADTKAVKPKTAPMDTATSLNESNNKIIKELDDETAKTFPQIVSQAASIVVLITCTSL